LGVEVHFNIISPYPGETREDCRKTFQTLNDISHFIRGRVYQVVFGLEYKSDVFSHPKKYGLAKMRPSRKMELLLPPPFRFSPTTEWDYSPSFKQRNLVPKPLLEGEGGGSLQLLEAGDDFCIVKDRRATRKRCDYVLPRPHRDVLLACELPKRRREIGCASSVLQELVRMGLLLKCGGMYLSLPLRKDEA
jgi:hypothetical protein